MVCPQIWAVSHTSYFLNTWNISQMKKNWCIWCWVVRRERRQTVGQYQPWAPQVRHKPLFSFPWPGIPAISAHLHMCLASLFWIYLPQVHAWKEATRLGSAMQTSIHWMALIGLQCVPSLGMGLDRGRSLAVLVVGDIRLSQEINPQSLVTTRTPGSVPGGSLLCGRLHMHRVFVQAVPEAGGLARCQNTTTIKPHSQPIPKHACLCLGWGLGSDQILRVSLVSCPRDILLSYQTRFCFLTCGPVKVEGERCAHSGWVFNQACMCDGFPSLSQNYGWLWKNSNLCELLFKFNKADIYGFVEAETWHSASDCLDCGVSV